MQTQMSNRMMVVSILAALCLLFAGMAVADEWTLQGIEGGVVPDNQGYDAEYYKRNGYQLDQRYNHGRYYPSVGSRYKSLPSDRRNVHYQGLDYFFYGGAWYRGTGAEYLVVKPPVGLSVGFLPSHYTTIWIGSVPYYYADGTYYTWSAKRKLYVVSEVPSQSEVVEQATVPGRLFIYPKQEQSEQQQATDRYECYSWARDESGFDPTLASGGVSEADNAELRAQYNRAMKACLEARGYSVQ
jgi:hypothetical protein